MKGDLRIDIASLQGTGLSIMPEGLEWNRYANVNQHGYTYNHLYQKVISAPHIAGHFCCVLTQDTWSYTTIHWRVDVFYGGRSVGCVIRGLPSAKRAAWGLVEAWIKGIEDGY
jgi:hypothetical protein